MSYGTGMGHVTRMSHGTGMGHVTRMSHGTGMGHVTRMSHGTGMGHVTRMSHGSGMGHVTHMSCARTRHFFLEEIFFNWTTRSTTHTSFPPIQLNDTLHNSYMSRNTYVWHDLYVCHDAYVWCDHAWRDAYTYQSLTNKTPFPQKMEWHAAQLIPGTQRIRMTWRIRVSWLICVIRRKSDITHTRRTRNLFLKQLDDTLHNSYAFHVMMHDVMHARMNRSRTRHLFLEQLDDTLNDFAILFQHRLHRPQLPSSTALRHTNAQRHMTTRHSKTQDKYNLYGVTTISRLLKITSLFCRISFLL